MKTLICIVVAVTVVTSPCLAEVEPNIGLFLLEGTVWEARPLPSLSSDDIYLGFSFGRIYSCDDRDGNVCDVVPLAFYLDLFGEGMPSLFFALADDGLVFGWTIPIIGIGGMTTLNMVSSSTEQFILSKTKDFWIYLP